MEKTNTVADLDLIIASFVTLNQLLNVLGPHFFLTAKLRFSQMVSEGHKQFPNAKIYTLFLEYFPLMALDIIAGCTTCMHPRPSVSKPFSLVWVMKYKSTTFPANSLEY